MIALSVAAVLAVFLLYTSIAGGGNPSIAPSELRGRSGEVQLAGSSSAPSSATHTPVASASVSQGHRRQGEIHRGVRYTGSVPDLFKVGRHIMIDGRLRKGVFVAEPGSMITKCPSKYSPKQSGDSA